MRYLSALQTFSIDLDASWQEVEPVGIETAGLVFLRGDGQARLCVAVELLDTPPPDMAALAMRGLSMLVDASAAPILEAGAEFDLGAVQARNIPGGQEYQVQAIVQEGGQQMERVLIFLAVHADALVWARVIAIPMEEHELTDLWAQARTGLQRLTQAGGQA